MIDVCLLGCGGMMPLPRRFLTSMMLRCQGHNILVDAGEGTQVALKRKGWSPNPIDLICFTHYHADHISGLPGLLLSMGNAERTAPLILVGPKGLSRVVNALRVIAPELPFEIVMKEIGEETEEFTLEELPDLTIRAFRVRHNVVCYGYSFELARAGRFDAEAARAREIPLPYWKILQKGETVEAPEGTFTPDMVLGPPRKGIKVCYTTDTRPCPAIAESAEGADLFICEGMYGEEDKLSSVKEKKHMLFREAAELAARAHVKRLWLTHFSPAVLRPEEFIGNARAVFPGAECGKDGKSITLRFEDEEGNADA